MLDADIITVSDPEELAQTATQRFTRMAQEAVGSRGRFSVALSGGSTPRALYELLARSPYRQRMPWEGLHLFWGDERCVPPSDPGSNFRLAEETLIAHVPIPPENIHRVQGELEPGAAARAYERTLRDFFCGPIPRLDLVLLGLGNDGHTASLFPRSTALEDTERLVVAVEAFYQDRPAHRVTLTLPAINTARQVLFLVSGHDKAEIVRSVLQGPDTALPAQRVQPTAGKLTWLLDAAAGSQLEKI